MLIWEMSLCTCIYWLGTYLCLKIYYYIQRQKDAECLLKAAGEDACVSDIVSHQLQSLRLILHMSIRDKQHVSHPTWRRQQIQGAQRSP